MLQLQRAENPRQENSVRSAGPHPCEEQERSRVDEEGIGPLHEEVAGDHGQ